MRERKSLRTRAWKGCAGWAAAPSEESGWPSSPIEETESISYAFGVLVVFIALRVRFEIVLMLVRELSGDFLVGMRDHALFFGSRFLFFQFLFLVFFFRRVGRVEFRAGSFRRGVGGSETTLLRVARRQIVLGVGDMLGERGNFFVAQVVVAVNVMRQVLGVFCEDLGSIAGALLMEAGYFRCVLGVAENVRMVDGRGRGNVRGIHVRARRHQRRERREANRLGNGRIVSRGVGRRIRRRIGRQMLMRLPFGKGFAGKRFDA